MFKLRSLTKRFRKNEDGVTAVEFALVATPFFLLLFAIIEVALIFTASLVLENATYEAARQVRTGQISGADPDDFTEFEGVICDGISFLLDCDGKLHIDVRPYADFRSAGEPDPYSTGTLGGGFGFDTGVAGNVVLVRVFTTWDILTPMIGAYFANESGNSRLISAYASFRNEPF